MLRKMSREDDFDETAALARHNELRDIHHRIDALKEEGERQFSSLSDKLHALEVAVARGARFPAAAWVAAAGIVLTIIGTGTVTYAKLETALGTSTKALSLIESHMQGSSARYQAIQDAVQFVDRWSGELPMVVERLKSLEGRIVGQGPDGWHRRDHDLYARYVDERLETLKKRADTVEAKQDALCERTRECKTTK